MLNFKNRNIVSNVIWMENSVQTTLSFPTQFTMLNKYHKLISVNFVKVVKNSLLEMFNNQQNLVNNFA